MDSWEYSKTRHVPKLKSVDVMQRMLDCCPGTNMTLPTIHSLVVTSQTTFDAKHRISSLTDDRHYNRPIKLLGLHYNRHPDGVYAMYDGGTTERVSVASLANLWHVCDAPSPPTAAAADDDVTRKNSSCSKCRSYYDAYGDATGGGGGPTVVGGGGNREIDPNRTLLFAEEVRKYTTDLFGAFFYHNLVKSMYADKGVFPSLLVYFQVFHDQKKHSVMSITRFSIAHLKDLVTTCMFESVEQKLQTCLNKKDRLLETTSRDLFGLPPLSGTNCFDLVFASGSYGSFDDDDHKAAKKRKHGHHADARSRVERPLRSTRHVSNTQRYVLQSPGVHRARPGADSGTARIVPAGLRRDGGIHTQEDGGTVSIRLRIAGFGERGECEAARERGAPEQDKEGVRVHARGGAASRISLRRLFSTATTFKKELPHSLSQCSPSDIKKCTPVVVNDPPSRVALRRLRRDCPLLGRLRQKMDVADFKRLILKNEGSSLYHRIMSTEYRESKYAVNKTFQLHCVVCSYKNKHLKRRKGWTCKVCKTRYHETVHKSKKEDKLKNLLNEEILVTDGPGPDAPWIVVPSPIRYMHQPRMMLEAVNRFFRDARRVRGWKRRPMKYFPTIKQQKTMKVSSQRLGNTPMKFYTYPRDVPMIYGSALDDLRGGKDNVFRKKIVSKRCFNTCRMVMTVDGDLKGHQISLPDVIWKNMGHPRYVVGIRYPSISNLNMTIHEVVVHSNYGPHLTMTARAPPAICKGHNLDFDGDAMTFISLDKESEYEMRVLLSPQWAVSANGALRVSFSRDAMIGLGACADGETPFHRVLAAELCRQYFSGESSSATVYRKFCEYEDAGRAAALKVVYTGNEASVLEYIAAQCGKMKHAHYAKMFEGEPNLTRGLSMEQFKESCVETRRALLDTPTNASDDGYVFSLAMHVLKDAVLQYDYTLRTQDGRLVSLYGFHMHPKYCFSRMDFYVPVTAEERSADREFQPLGCRVTLEKVEMDTTWINPIFRNVCRSGLMSLYKVTSGLPEKTRVYGRLHFSPVMRAMGMDNYSTYVAYMHVYGESYVSYLFRFV